MTNEELIVLSRTGDKEAENQLYRQNKNLFHHFAKRFRKKHIEYEDLVSIARIAFWEACQKFDPDNGTKLVTYAAYFIQNRIKKSLRLQQKRRGHVDHFDDIVFAGKDGSDTTIEGMIGEEDIAFDRLETSEALQKVLSEFDQQTTEREKEVLVLRIENELNQRDTGRKLGVSQVHISRVEKKIFTNLRNIAIEHGLQGSFIKGEVKDMSKVNIPSFVYLVKNYPDLKQADTARILGVSQGLISMYSKSYEKGKYDDVLPDSGNLDERVAEYIRNYYPEKLAGEVKTTYIEALPKIEEDVEVKLDPEHQPKEHKIEDEILPPKIEEMLRDKSVWENVPLKHDTINSPSHYTAGGIEVIDYMQAKMTKEQFVGYLLGNIFKYTSRFQFKNGLEDLKKGSWYISKLIEVMESEPNHSHK